MVTLFTATDVKLYNYLAGTGHLVLHIDGSTDKMPLDLLVKEGDTQQIWPLMISPSFILQERSVAL